MDSIIFAAQQSFLIWVLFLSSSCYGLLIEDYFVGKYGDNPETSGRWETVRMFYKNRELLKDVATAAHRAAYPTVKYTIRTAIAGTAVLVFSKFSKFVPLMIDLIEYEVNEEGLTSQFKYITKGLREITTVHYLWKMDHEGTKFRLGTHIGDVAYPLGVRLKLTYAAVSNNISKVSIDTIKNNLPTIGKKKFY